jgi:hypothetical protein
MALLQNEPVGALSDYAKLDSLGPSLMKSKILFRKMKIWH